MPDAIFNAAFDKERVTLAAGISAGEIWQMKSGLAAYNNGIARSSGDQPEFTTEGVVTVTKSNGVVILDGGRVYWDHSAGSATYKPANDRDFYIGVAVGDWESGDLLMNVRLNAQQANIIDFQRDAFDTVLIGTQAVGGFGEWKSRGGAVKCNITSTSEAQKADMLSQFAFDKTANAIVELIFNVRDDGSGTVVDVSMGVANDTHASNADTITESCFIHLDANDTRIFAESDDNAAGEVNATDTTITYTAGTPVEVWFDFRNPADIQIYINAALVLGSTTFTISAATGPFKLLLHVEKSSAADTYEIDINRFHARIAEQ
jgi:predicted RecA/RadA family phage recombinase